MSEKQYTGDNPRALLEQCGDFFMAMGDRTRRSLFLDMVEAGKEGVNVKTLTSRTKLSRPAISHHLKILKDAGLIKPRHQGTNNFYYVDIQEELENVKRFIACAEKIVDIFAQE